VFTVTERDRVRGRLLELAEGDPDVVAAAITGSYALDGGDEWSDIDLAFGIRGRLAAALAKWKGVLYEEFGAIHDWDLPWGATVYRVFLLPKWLQVDIAFTPESDFGPRGPNWRTVFGKTVAVSPTGPGSRDDLVGWAWVLARHAQACIERRKPWQAEWSISGVRDNVLALACLRLGYPTRYAKGAHLLPRELTEPLEAALVRSLDAEELRRALAAAVAGFADELKVTDPELSARIAPMFSELVSHVR
jgi:hypothetical protein